MLVSKVTGGHGLLVSIAANGHGILVIFPMEKSRDMTQHHHDNALLINKSKRPFSTHQRFLRLPSLPPSPFPILFPNFNLSSFIFIFNIIIFILFPPPPPSPPPSPANAEKDPSLSRSDPFSPPSSPIWTLTPAFRFPSVSFPRRTPATTRSPPRRRRHRRHRRRRPASKRNCPSSLLSKRPSFARKSKRFTTRTIITGE